MKKLIARIKALYIELDNKDLNPGWSVHIPLLIVFIYLATFNLVSSTMQWAKPFSFLLTPQIFFFVSLLIVSIFLKIGPGRLGLSLSDLKKNIKIGIYTSIIPFILVVLFIILPLIIWQGIWNEGITVLDGFAKGSFTSNKAYLIQLLILAPIFEELFFRGFLIPPLKRTLPLWAVVLISSLVFMLAHGYLKFGAFLLGLFTSVIFIWTGSVIPGMLFHFSCNLWGPLLVYLFPEIHKTIYFLFK